MHWLNIIKYDYMCIYIHNYNNLFRHLNNSRNNSLKCNQIMLKQIIIIKYVSSFCCGRLQWKEQFLSPEVYV